MTRALAVFHDHGCHALDRFLRPGFRHCFAVVDAGGTWVRLDAMAGRPVVDVVCASSYDLATFYRQEGFHVIETKQNDQPPAWPWVVANCVGLVKTVLCISAPLAVTPWGLYRHMTGTPRRFALGSLLPGKSLFSPPKPPAPVIIQQPAPEAPPPPPPPPPEREDPAIAEAARKSREDELKRRGRRASILTSGRGVTEDAPLGRPSAQAGADTLGG